jgi:hypothetical protein
VKVNLLSLIVRLFVCRHPWWQAGWLSLQGITELCSHTCFCSFVAACKFLRVALVVVAEDTGVQINVTASLSSRLLAFWIFLSACHIWSDICCFWKACFKHPLCRKVFFPVKLCLWPFLCSWVWWECLGAWDSVRPGLLPTTAADQQVSFNFEVSSLSTTPPVQYFFSAGPLPVIITCAADLHTLTVTVTVQC